MTRSRAKALATPGPSEVTKPAATTGRRKTTRSAKDVEHEQDATKELFKDEIAVPAEPSGDASSADQAVKEATVEPAAEVPVEAAAEPTIPATIEEAPVSADVAEEAAAEQQELPEWSSPDSTGGKSAAADAEEAATAVSEPAVGPQEEEVQADSGYQQEPEQPTAEDMEMQRAMEEAADLDVSSVADDDVPDPAEISMEGLEEPVQGISAELQEQEEPVAVLEVHEPAEPSASTELPAADADMMEQDDAAAASTIEELPAAEGEPVASEPEPKVAATSPLAKAHTPAVKSTPACGADAAKTPKTANKTAGKPQRHVGFGSSSVKWSTPLPTAAPKTPGFLSIAHAGATPASKKIEKKVSITTPLHPKSAASMHAVVRTPFPKSSEKAQPDEEMEEVVGSGDALDSGDINAAAGSPAREHTSPLAAALEQAGNDMMDAEEQRAASSSPAAEQSTSSPKPTSETKAARPATASGSYADKYAKGQAALQALASAEEAAVRPSTAPSSRAVPSFMQPTAAAKLKSKVVVPDNYDPRSLSQLRREIKEAEARKAEKKAAALKTYGLDQVRDPKAKAAPGPVRPKPSLVRDEDEEDDTEAMYNAATEDALVTAITQVEIEKPGAKPAPLKGLPLPQGKHIRFTSKGKAKESPSSGKVPLRGLPAAEGKHIRFD